MNRSAAIAAACISSFLVALDQAKRRRESRFVSHECLQESFVASEVF
jgi:hypothetical protein